MPFHQQQDWLGCDVLKLGQSCILIMETNGICRIACATIVAATLVSMSACTIVPHQSPESQAFLAPQNNVNQLAANDYINQCGEQIRLLKHEVALCRAVPLITVPLQ
jgi:hypothetical protein